MASIEDLGARVEQLLLRHEELRRAHALAEQQLTQVTAERDALRSRLGAARQRIDALLDRLQATAVLATAVAAGERSAADLSAAFPGPGPGFAPAPLAMPGTELPVEDHAALPPPALPPEALA